MNYMMQTIGIIHSPYAEKFGIPRQPDLVTAASATLTLLPPFNHPDCVRGLEQFSHVWLHFIFHQTKERGWHPLVRPPRLGGNKKIGVFASRSSHRPNSLGLSLVRLVEITTQPAVVLHLEGVDLLDGTPVIDIRPYLPFVESRPEACSGYVDGPPPTIPVHWSPAAQAQLKQEDDYPPDFRLLVEQVLEQDPRPAYQRENTLADDRVYGIILYEYDIRFHFLNEGIEVIEINNKKSK